MAGGKRGPKRQSKEANNRKGNPGKRTRATKAPALPAGMPTPPTWLPTVAREEWNRVVPHLHQSGLLIEVDQAALVSYCIAVANLKSATETLADGKTTFQTEKGYVGKHPAATLQREAMQTVLKFSQEFGLTPAARDKLDIKPIRTPGDSAGGVGAYAKSKGS